MAAFRARMEVRSAKLSTTMEGIAGMTAQTSAGTRQSAIAVSRVAELADALRASVSTFRLPGGPTALAEAELQVVVGSVQGGTS